MITLLIRLMNAKTTHEVNEIVDKNIHLIPINRRYFFTRFANTSKMRINRIEQEKRRSWTLAEQN